MSAADPDGVNDIVALIQASGLAGYKKPEEGARQPANASTAAAPAEDAALFALIRKSGLPGYDRKRLEGQA